VPLFTGGEVVKSFVYPFYVEDSRPGAAGATFTQQIAYTLNESEAEIVPVHVDCVPVLEQIKAELKGAR
jgi:hypothetical protein